MYAANGHAGLSEAFLRDCASRPNSPEAGVAHRIHGVTKSFAGEFDDARAHLEKALAIFENEQDDDLAFRFGMDTGIAAMIQAAMAYWPLGEFDLARRQADAMATRLGRVRHIATAAYGHTFAAMFEIMRRDYDRAALSASALVNLSKDQEMPQWNAFANFFEGWSESRTGDANAGILRMRNAIAFLHEQKVALFGPLFKSLLAEAEAEAGQNAAAIETLNQALAKSIGTGSADMTLNCIALAAKSSLKQNPADPAPAEAAFLAAIAVAQQQKARSFELRAALSLAKLYRATGRPPTRTPCSGQRSKAFRRRRNFRRSREAEALFDGLAETDEVKSASAAQQTARRSYRSPTATRSSPRAATARRKRRKRSPRPASRRPGTRARRGGLRPTTDSWVGTTCEAS